MSETPRSCFDFGEALRRVKAGKAVARENWNTPRSGLHFQDPDENTENTHPYLYVTYCSVAREPYIPSYTDLFAEDWFEVLL